MKHRDNLVQTHAHCAATIRIFPSCLRYRRCCITDSLRRKVARGSQSRHTSQRGIFRDSWSSNNRNCVQHIAAAKKDSCMESAPVCLTIAGSDSGGGAGIQADLKTFSALGVFGTSAITALTAQNTQGVHDAYTVEQGIVKSQINAVLDDMQVDVVKIGMLPSIKTVETLFACLQKRPALKAVLDPVLISTSGHSLAASDVAQAIKEKLLGLVTILTPNLAEAAALLGNQSCASIEEMENAARELHKLGPKAVLVKGGHLPEASNGHQGQQDLIDVFYDGESMHHIPGPRITTSNTHGTGCTTASAIAAFLARGHSLLCAVQHARSYVTDALAASKHLQIGNGPQRPFNHLHHIDDWKDRRRLMNLHLYAVTDPACNEKWNRANAQAVDLAIQGGATIVQLREKSADGARFCEEAAQVLEVCRQHNVTLIINDRIDVALAVGADGVHVGQDDIPATLARKLLGPGKLLGVSVKTVEQAQKAEQDGADYLGAGAMFQTATKSSSTISFETLATICQSVSIPVVAIGGLNSSSVNQCIQAGCKGIAVVSAIFGNEDPCKAAKEIKAEVERNLD